MATIPVPVKYKTPLSHPLNTSFFPPQKSLEKDFMSEPGFRDRSLRPINQGSNSVQSAISLEIHLKMDKMVEDVQEQDFIARETRSHLLSSQRDGWFYIILQHVWQGLHRMNSDARENHSGLTIVIKSRWQLLVPLNSGVFGMLEILTIFY